MRITSSAPTRIDLAGGTIDIWPLYLFHEQAMTLNVAISLRAHVTIESRMDGGLELVSVDTHRRLRASRWSELRGDSELPLLALLARHYRLENATLTTRGESPAGAGIAGSSALAIATCGALARYTGASVEPEDLLQVADSSGLQWVNSDADKIAQAQAAIAAEPKPVHVPRERAPLVLIDEGPLVLVETRKDLSQVTLPFDAPQS